LKGFLPPIELARCLLSAAPVDEVLGLLKPADCEIGLDPCDLVQVDGFDSTGNERQQQVATLDIGVPGLRRCGSEPEPVAIHQHDCQPQRSQSAQQSIAFDTPLLMLQ